MPSARQIINDLRAQARALDGCHVSGSMMDGVCHSLQRGADELERMSDELHMLRAWAEIPEDRA